MISHDRKIMSPVDVDELIKRLKACMQSRDVLYNIAISNDNASDVQQAIKAYDSARDFLMMHIMRNDIEVLDLIERGRSDDSVRLYEHVNGRLIPYEPKED